MFWCRLFLIDFYFLEHCVPFLTCRLFKKVFYNHIFESFTCSARSVPFSTNSNCCSHWVFFAICTFIVLYDNFTSLSFFSLFCNFFFPVCYVVDNILVTWLLFLILPVQLLYLWYSNFSLLFLCWTLPTYFFLLLFIISYLF